LRILTSAPCERERTQHVQARAALSRSSRQNPRKPCRRKKAAFTLAEVLITIGVIGVVAAITIPALMTNINKRVIAHKKVVMEKKLLDGLNMMSNRENGLSVKYNNTEEFVRALSKYLKIVTICSNTTLNKCFPYNKVNYDANGETKSVDLTSITTAKKLKLTGGNWLDPAGFVMADGTPIIISYNNDCGDDIKVDPDKPSKSIPTACIDGLYDNNGSRPQNKFGKDVLAFGNAKIGTSCTAEVGSTCFTSAPVVPTPMTKAECEAQKSTLGINACNYDNDYWAGAMKMCKDQGGRLPTEAELAQLASELYGTTIGSTESKSGLSLDTNKLPESFAGLSSSWSFLWSGSEGSASYAYGRYFGSSTTGRSYYTRYDSDIRAVCVGE